MASSNQEPIDGRYIYYPRSGSKAQASSSLCKKHPPTLVVPKFCQTCWELFCPDCEDETSTQHDGHDVLAKPVDDNRTPRQAYWGTPGSKKDQQHTAAEGLLGAWNGSPSLMNYQHYVFGPPQRTRQTSDDDFLLEPGSPVFDTPSSFRDDSCSPPLAAFHQQPRSVAATGRLDQLQNGSCVPYEEVVRQLNQHFANSPSHQSNGNSAGGRKQREYLQPSNRSHIKARPLIMVRNIGGRQNSPVSPAQIGTLGWPKGFTVDPEGNVVVADCSNNRIQIFMPDGSLYKAWGYQGVAPGCLNGPFKVAVVEEPSEGAGFVYVVCDHAPDLFSGDDIANYIVSVANGRARANRPGAERAGRIQVFNVNGVYKRPLVAPLAMKITSVEGSGRTLFIVDGGNDQVIAFHDYVVAYTISFRGRVVELSEICIHDDAMYACDYKGHRVVAVSLKTQRTISEFGEEALAFPNGIWVDAEAERVMVADSHENRLRVTVFSLATHAFQQQFIYQGDKVSHIVGLKMIKKTKELVVLNRPGRAIRNIAGHILVLRPLDWLTHLLPDLFDYLTSAAAGDGGAGEGGELEPYRNDQDAAAGAGLQQQGSSQNNVFNWMLPDDAASETNKVRNDALQLFDTPPHVPRRDRDGEDDMQTGAGYGSSAGSSLGSLPLLFPADETYRRFSSLPASPPPPPPRSFFSEPETAAGGDTDAAAAGRGARRSLSFGGSNTPMTTTTTGGVWGYAVTPVLGAGGGGALGQRADLYPPGLDVGAWMMRQGSDGAAGTDDEPSGGTGFDSIEEAFSKWADFN